MTERQPRILLACSVAALAAVLGATTALAATTWTIKPGGAVTASAPDPNVTDTTTRAKATCTSMTARGTLKSGSGLSGAGAGSISAFAFNSCTSPLRRVTWLLTATDLPWHLNLFSGSGGVITGSISHMQIKLAGPGCTVIIDGTSATASDGHIKFSYGNGTGHLKTLTTGGNLHAYNVNGCFGLYHTGDPITISANFTLNPKQAITSP